jgi:Domain of unknown function (DUF4249)
MNLIRLLLFCLAAIEISSCQTTDVVNLPFKNPKLVVNCIAQNDSLFSVTVSSSLGILDSPQFPPDSNASLVLYENDKFIETLTVKTNKIEARYFSKYIRPKAGNSYRLEATSENYASVSASYVQPLPVKIDTATFQILGNRFLIDDLIVQFRLEFTDPPEENYYEIRFIDPNVPFFTGIDYVYNPSFVDPAYDENNRLYIGKQGVIFSDNYFNGRKAVIDIAANASNGGSRKFIACLRHLTKESYLYLLNVNQQQQGADDPYTQPVPIENNIKNGLGIFGGFTQTSKVLE